MYGIVNQAIQGLVTEKFGEDTWLKVKEKSNVEDDFFLSNESYDDSVTYQLAGATAEVLDISLADVLVAFGEYWVLKTGLEKYGSLMKSGGDNLKEFIVNLPNFHSRVMLMYPKLNPPEFKISDESEDAVHVHYYSERAGLSPFVVGIFQGLGKMYKTDVKVDHIEVKAEGADHDVFQVSWN